MIDENISPESLKRYSIQELELLAENIRKRIVDTLSKTGGHLSSNLGVVELTLAMHYSFNSPIDKFIFDVSHQMYPHKLLTGRDKLFDSLRQFNGLCGFSHPDESEHDHFYSGHAGTALPLALGVANQRDINNENYHVVPIIGDATLTCGLTLEALNNIDENLKNFVVILNDNKMSISKNVGNIKTILSRLINSPTSNKLYLDIQNLLAKIPTYGNLLAKQGKKVTESIKNLVSPAPFFEQLNLSYIGPIDGHNIKKLIEIFEKIKYSKHPVILHVITTKGKGLSDKALENPSYHGVKPFHKETLEPLSKSSKITFPKVFGSHIIEMAKKDDKLILVNPATLHGSCLDSFMEKYKPRCFDVGIAEGHCITFAAGLAYKKKLNVIVSIYSTFLQRALDNLFHDVCLQKLPIVFAIDRAGLSGPDGKTHHGIYDISFLNAMPNMIIAQPRNANILKEILNVGFSFKKPLAIRYPNLTTEEVDIPLRTLSIASYDILSRGEDVLIVSLGHMYKTALELKDKLEKIGINPTIVDPIFIKPLNENLFLTLLQTHSTIITIEEHSLNSGFGSIFNNFMIRNNIQNKNVINFGLPDKFIEHGKNEDLTKDLKLDTDSIFEKILSYIPSRTSR